MEGLKLFYKPNQLISVGKEDISRLQFESMNVLLKKAQDKIHYNVGISDGTIKKKEGEKALSEAEMLTYRYYINIDDYMDSVSLSLRPKDMRVVESLLKDLSMTQLESHHKTKIEFQNIFQSVAYNINHHRIEFEISNSITKLFMSKCGLIDEKGEYQKGHYTAIPHYNKKFKELIGNVKLSDSSLYFYEWIMQYAKQSQQNIYTDEKPFYTHVKIEDLKDILGCKSYSLQDFKKKILKKAKDDLSKLKFYIDYSVIGRGKNAEDITITIYKNSIVPDFIYSEVELLTKDSKMLPKVTESEIKTEEEYTQEPHYFIPEESEDGISFTEDNELFEYEHDYYTKEEFLLEIETTKIYCGLSIGKFSSTDIYNYHVGKSSIFEKKIIDNYFNDYVMDDENLF